MWGELISAGAGLLGSWMSSDAAEDSSERSQQTTEKMLQLYAEAAQRFGELTPPDLAGMFEPLQRAVSMGEITPEQYVAAVQEQTALAGIKLPPQIIDAQYKALADMQQIANEGGLTAIDRQKLNNIRSDIATQEKGKRDAIAMDAQRRGVSGSGLELMQQISNQQGAATRESAAGFDVAAAAQKRALEGITESGRLAGQLRDDEYLQQSDEAKARDMINKFNTSNRQTATDATIKAKNDAQAANLATKYNLQTFNIGQAAKDAAARTAAAQDNWSNTLDLAKARANIATGQAAGMNQQATDLGKLSSAQSAAAIQQLGQAAGNVYKAFNPDEKKKDGE